jgi:CheY-like chemotaxis protein
MPFNHSMAIHQQQNVQLDKAIDSSPQDAHSADNALKILFVEDNEELRDVGSEMLALLGYEVFAASSAEGAVAMLKNRPFDVLFSDIRLPGMTGIELAEKARALSPDLKIILASGYGSAVEVDQNLRAAILPKPYVLNQLQKILESE